MRVAVPFWQRSAETELEPYFSALRDAGLEPVALDQPSPDLEGCIGLLLSGGVDIDPAFYGEERDPRTQASFPARDHLEATLLNSAIENDVPIFAICRGFQLLNVILGGSLLQHIEDDAGASHAIAHVPKEDEARSSSQHKVSLQGFLGELAVANRVLVNSRHHQAVTLTRLAPQLEPLSFSDDGLVEAAFSPSHRWILGVQWHPERREPDIPGFAALSGRLFAAFAEQVELGFRPFPLRHTPRI